MASKLRTYAENELGVHKVHEEAKAAQGELVDLHAKLNQARDQRRRLTEEIADREVEVWKELRNTNPELSATALDGKVKLERRTDSTLQELRRGLLDTQKLEDEHEQAIKAVNKRIDIATARMIQLGGYLPFLFEIMKGEAVAHQNTP